LKVVSLPDPITMCEVLRLIRIGLNPIALNRYRKPGPLDLMFQVENVLHVDTRCSPNGKQSMIALHVAHHPFVPTTCPTVFTARQRKSLPSSLALVIFQCAQASSVRDFLFLVAIPPVQQRPQPPDIAYRSGFSRGAAIC
jgi:hypothetical protein